MKSLVKRAQRGDDQAFVELIEENKQAMYKVAVGILKNDFDAADAIQQSILTCYEKLKELKKAQYFKTWLLRILINNCNQMLREQRILCKPSTGEEYSSDRRCLFKTAEK